MTELTRKQAASVLGIGAENLTRHPTYDRVLRPRIEHYGSITKRFYDANRVHALRDERERHRVALAAIAVMGGV